MIFDLGTGYHESQVEYLTLGWMQTWVSGDSQANPVTLVGIWHSPIIVEAFTGPIEAHAATRVEL